MFGSQHKSSFRLKGYDYRQDGLYFVTVCSANFHSYFGEIRNERMILNSFGKIIQGEWLRTPFLRKYVKLHEFQIMPNHLHGIIEIHELPLPYTEIFSPYKLSPTHKNKFGGKISLNLFAIMRGFKGSAKTIINSIQNEFVFDWQVSFQDRIIRDDEEYKRIVRHIKENPKKWPRDPNNPQSPTFKGVPSIY